MRWRKLGRVFAPPTDLPWLASHAALPVAEPLGSGCRVYFAGRDGRGRARIGTVDLDLGAAGAAPVVRPTPVLDLGPLGAFDDSGVTPSCLVEQAGRKYLYYTGWSLGVTVPFYLFAGVAVSEDGGRGFARASAAPILERCDADPYLTASPWVLVENGCWRMWYVAGSRWESVDGQPRHYYHIRYAESADGLTWRRHPRPCIDYASPEEYAISRPCVVRDRDTYRMWYASRGAAYRIGYAESADGLHWTRRDAEAGIDVSPSGWDSEMVAYPCVFDAVGRRYLLYNGNGYGRTGIGLAVETGGPERS
jgi:hypothetical protein